MNSEKGEVFLGGISYQTTEKRLKNYFTTFGEVVEAVIIKDRFTGRSRGFGFLVFADPAVAEGLLLNCKHDIDGRLVEVKKVNYRHSRSRDNSVGNGVQNLTRTKRIFIGGLAHTVTDNDMRRYFEQFGTITDVIVIYDPRTQRPRGFGFVTFESEDVVDVVVQMHIHELNGKMVEVNRATPKQRSARHIRFPAGRGGDFGANNEHFYNYPPTPVGGYALAMNNSYNGALRVPAVVMDGYGNTTFVNNVPVVPVAYGAPICYGVPVPYGAPISYGFPVSNAGLYVDDAYGGPETDSASISDAEQNNGNDAGDAEQNNGNDAGDAEQNNGNNAGDAEQNNGNDAGDAEQNNGNHAGDAEQNNGNNGNNAGDAEQNNGYGMDVTLSPATGV